MRQLIIVRKDLNMSTGKLLAQVSHASMAFIVKMMKEGNKGYGVYDLKWNILLEIENNMWRDWFNGSFTKTVCGAKNRNQLLKAKNIAETLGLVENKDFFLIKDNCLTELTPEEVDEDGVGRTLTCIGFKPLPDDVAHIISKKYQLY